MATKLKISPTFFEIAFEGFFKMVWPSKNMLSFLCLGLYLFLLFVPQEVLKLAELGKANSLCENLFIQSFLLEASEFARNILK